MTLKMFGHSGLEITVPVLTSHRWTAGCPLNFVAGLGTLGPGTLGTGTLDTGTLGTGTCELDRPGNFWSGRKDAELPRLSIIFLGFARVWKGQLAHGSPTGALGARLWLWADEPGGFAGNFWALFLCGVQPQGVQPPIPEATCGGFLPRTDNINRRHVLQG